MSEDLDLLDELAELAQEIVHDGVQMYADGGRGQWVVCSVAGTGGRHCVSGNGLSKTGHLQGGAW